MTKRFITKSLKDHRSMQCYIHIYEDGTIELVSYYTLVLRAVRKDEDTREYWIESHGTFWDNERVFTPTTARHISYFLREYFPSLSYYDFKYAAEKTGEVLTAELSKGVDLNYEW